MASAADEHWMAVALAEAHRAEEAGEVPVGAVVVLGERELARAHNAPIGLCDPTAHAEVLAIRRAALEIGSYRLPGSTLYATIEPCCLCLGAALHARVGRLVYGAPDAKGGAAGSVVDLTSLAGVNHRIDVESGVLRTECARVLQEFFQRKRTTGSAVSAEDAEVATTAGESVLARAKDGR